MMRSRPPSCQPCTKLVFYLLTHTYGQTHTHIHTHMQKPAPFFSRSVYQHYPAFLSVIDKGSDMQALCSKKRQLRSVPNGFFFSGLHDREYGLDKMQVGLNS